MAQNKHYLTLDGLRGVAAICVMLYHRRMWMSGGHLLDHSYMAVDFFFMLSGFVLAHAYGEKLSHGLSFWNFCKIRTIRLYPMGIVGAGLGLLYLAFKSIHDAYALKNIALSAPL